MLQIVSAPNQVLSQEAKCLPLVKVKKDNSKFIPKIDSEILKLIEEMKQTLLAAKDPEGVGLAAPQVGKNLKIFLIRPTAKSKIQTFINPEITKIFNDLSENQKPNQPDSDDNNGVSLKSEDYRKLEGCLSLPNIWGTVERFSHITLSYFDEDGNHHERKFSGFIATIIQHEMDHLKGTLFPKRVLEQKGKLYKSHRNEKGEDIFEELEI